MKLHTRTNTVEMDGVSRTGNFEIRKSAKAFEILSSGIYSDPILAVIRELSSNAWDAHKAAGKEAVSFTIHLPTALEPWFSVIDDGIGLSEDDIFGLYTTYFDSTKNDSNDFIGALGLGSKSPFSYAKAFEVTSRFDGKKTIYSIYINDEGFPAVSKMAEVDHIGSNGIEVKMSVEQRHFRDFADKAKQALRFFDPQPIIIGNKVEFDPIPEKATRGDNYIAWYADWNERYYHGSELFTAVQGNVQYRVDVEKLTRLLDKSEKEFVKTYKIVGFFDIGQLEVAASREEIRYDKETVTNLIKLIKEIRNDYLKRLDDELSGAIKGKKSRYAAYTVLNLHSGQVSEFAGIAKGYKFKNNIVTRWIKDNGKVSLYVDGKREAPNTYELMVVHKNYGKKAVRSETIGTMRPAGNTIVIVDVRGGYSARMEQYLNDNRLSKVCAIRPVAPWQVRKTNTQLTTDKKQLEKIYEDDLKSTIKILGDPDVVYLSEETTAPKKGSSNRRQGLVVKSWDGNYDGDTYVNPKWLDDGELTNDPSKTYYYVPIALSGKFYDATGNVLDGSSCGHRDWLSYLQPMIQLLNRENNEKRSLFTTKDESNQVYGLTKKSQKMVAKMPNWKNLFEAVNKIVAKYQYVLDYVGRVRASHIDGSSVREWTGVELEVSNLIDLHNVNGIEEVLKALDDSSEFKQALQPACDIRNRIQKELVSTTMINNVRDGLHLYFDGKENLRWSEETSFFDQKSIVEKYALVLALDRGLITTPAGRKIYTQAILSCEL